MKWKVQNIRACITSWASFIPKIDLWFWSKSQRWNLIWSRRKYQNLRQGDWIWCWMFFRKFCTKKKWNMHSYCASESAMYYTIIRFTYLHSPAGNHANASLLTPLYLASCSPLPNNWGERCCQWLGPLMTLASDRSTDEKERVAA